jgi:hypothetical protein
MFGNVWSIIWPKQRIVIGNARTTAAGGAADPDAPAAGRRALLASRMNVIFSIPMLFFMVGTSHFFVAAHFKFQPSGSDRAVYWIIVLVTWLAFELDAVGVIGGTGPGPLKWPYETHRNAIISGFVLAVVYYALWEIVFRV